MQCEEEKIVPLIYITSQDNPSTSIKKDSELRSEESGGKNGELVGDLRKCQETQQHSIAKLNKFKIATIICKTRCKQTILVEMQYYRSFQR